VRLAVYPLDLPTYSLSVADQRRALQQDGQRRPNALFPRIAINHRGKPISVMVLDKDELALASRRLVLRAFDRFRDGVSVQRGNGGAQRECVHNVHVTTF